MKLTRSIRIVAVYALLSAAGTSLAAVTWNEQKARELGASVAALAEEHEVVGIAVGAVVNGEYVFTEGFGVAQLGGTKPVSAKTVFHWASVSKPFVAVAVMQLVERGELELDDKLVEPNSALGEAINYLLRRWDSLTLFLRKAGAPLDNNLCERALKKAILHRKNSMFYKTRRGALVGDIYMSLIYSCELASVNALEYLNHLQLHGSDVAEQPDRWLPWNYGDNLVAKTDAA